MRLVHPGEGSSVIESGGNSLYETLQSQFASHAEAQERVR
jgi:hypothetical protein